MKLRVSAVPPTKGEDVLITSQLENLKIVKMLPPVFHQALSMNPRTKEEIAGSGNSSDEDGPLDDEEDPQTDGMEVDSTKESRDDDFDEDVEEKEDVEAEDEFTKMIQSSLGYIIQHDKKELMELLTELIDEAAEDYIGILLELEELIDAFLIDEFLEGNPIFPMIGELRRKLQSSHHRLKCR